MFSFLANLVSKTEKVEDKDDPRLNEDIYNFELAKYISDLSTGVISTYHDDFNRCRLLDELYEKAYKSKHHHEPSIEEDFSYYDIPEVPRGAYTEDGETLEENVSGELLIKFRNKVLNKLALVSHNNDFLNDFVQFVYEMERSTGADIFSDDYDVLPEFNQYIN